MLVTDRFHLFPAIRRDAAALSRYYLANWEHLQPWEPKRRADPRTLIYWQNQLLLQEKDHEAQASLMLLIRSKEQIAAKGEIDILGTIRFSQIFRGGFQACYLGVGLAQSAVGQGVMQEALPRAIDHVFTDWNLHRIMANYLPRNERSGRMLARLGFVTEGLAKDYLQINGVWEDHVLTAKTNTTLPPVII